MGFLISPSRIRGSACNFLHRLYGGSFLFETQPKWDKIFLTAPCKAVPRSALAPIANLLHDLLGSR